MGVFQIPGNIKQEILPFVLNPEAGINKPVDGGSTNLKDSKLYAPQCFTYKSSQKDLGGGLGKLNFFPSAYNDSNFKLDLSNQLLYNRGEDGKITTEQVTLTSILNSVPGVQIREYLPDTRLDQCINFFLQMFESISRVTQSNKESSGTGKQAKNKDQSWLASLGGFAVKLLKCVDFSINYMLGTIQPSFVGNVLDGLSSINTGAYGSGENISQHAKYVLRFPYALYYTLQGCVTTNIYEIPAMQQSKRIDGSEGAPGWTGASSTGMRLTELIHADKLPMIGNLINGLLGNIAIDYLPWWNPTAGSQTKEPEVVIEFDLFNDSDTAAMANFIFVNTIVPHNKWIQYHLFQHSSSLYDIKIEGINRLFACAGTFDVTYQGVLRDPPASWIEKLCDVHANRNSLNKDTLKFDLLRNKIIKIPDVYHVSLKFQSLLPANYNNFIYNFSSNNVITRETDKFGYVESKGGKAFNDAVGNFFGAVKDVWNSSGYYIDNDKVKGYNGQKYRNVISDGAIKLYDWATEEKQK